MTNHQGPPNRISVGEAVRISGFSRQQVYNLIRAGTVKAEKLGWEYWINVKSFTTYCEEHGRSLAKAG